VLEQAKDGYHQIGTTRMGTAPGTSVVNSDCQVHDVRNLHVASSSVFPTSSQANPTLLAAALAVRLAETIAQKSNK
jgi:choline dehydrogenase-like flavoprotein